MLFFKRKSYDSPLNASTIAPVHRSEGYLQGQLLVSTPLITASCFHKSVIYLFAHNEDGAMGIIVNQPLEYVTYDALLEESDLPRTNSDDEIAVYYGGPVDRSRGFVIHSTDYNKGELLCAHDGIAVSANTGILKDIAEGHGPAHATLVVGYAGWTAGQLEREIEENSWITVPATRELVFDIDDEMKWGMASQSLGIDMNFFSHSVGHA